MTTATIVLASSSRYRRALLDKLGLDRLGLECRTDAPDIDEQALPGEAPATLVERLALAKARAVAPRHPNALIIGSDQVASIDGQMLGKPGGHQAAIAQLERLAGRQVCFLTGLCLLNSATGRSQSCCESFWVSFRHLSQKQIAAYVERERPYDCAGAFKSEGLGIALSSRLEGADPNSLIGLPLIRLIAMLEAEGIEVLGP
ncbi:Maf family protein [Thiorhodovibrio frisius]|uniref:7-methyl-GTP pyrophosphatase n=1 Tax=Thiorhodovibrio frisius TaxID=631362 RepID=H8YXE2_9GAMM|nr:Maf family protein [Thiorhodovibrio frisius]EIC23118.1 MAF protein [Thiorhodovibrio frisius]WPL22618.1 Maf-like protein YceF [Thiorhodovibrio frisius]